MTLWAIGKYDLHLSDKEFWSLTLREFSALCDRRAIEVERADFRSSVLCSLVANAWFKKQSGGKFSYKDFMPELQAEEHKRKQTPEDMLNSIKLWQAMYEVTNGKLT